MKKLIAAGNLYLKKMDLFDIALLKLCLGALGVLIGLGAARKHRKSAGVLAGLVFCLTYVPLMGRFFRAIVTGDEEE